MTRWIQNVCRGATPIKMRSGYSKAGLQKELWTDSCNATASQSQVRVTKNGQRETKVSDAGRALWFLDRIMTQHELISLGNDNQMRFRVLVLNPLWDMIDTFIPNAKEDNEVGEHRPSPSTPTPTSSGLGPITAHLSLNVCISPPGELKKEKIKKYLQK